MEKHIVLAYHLLTVSELSWFLDTAGPGDKIRYYRGFIACDLSPHAEWHLPYQRDRLENVAALARRAEEKGKAYLFQRRIGPGTYDYLIQIRAPAPVSSAGANRSDSDMMACVSAAPEQLDMFRGVPS
jgi:hypothetical protein